MNRINEIREILREQLLPELRIELEAELKELIEIETRRMNKRFKNQNIKTPRS